MSRQTCQHIQKTELVRVKWKEFCQQVSVCCNPQKIVDSPNKFCSNNSTRFTPTKMLRTASFWCIPRAAPHSLEISMALHVTHRSQMMPSQSGLILQSWERHADLLTSRTCTIAVACFRSMHMDIANGPIWHPCLVRKFVKWGIKTYEVLQQESEYKNLGIKRWVSNLPMCCQ